MSAQTVVKFLREVFSTRGIPDLLVSDNGTAFTSRKVRDFLRRNDIHYYYTSPFHPPTNGLAGEWYVV